MLIDQDKLDQGTRYCQHIGQYSWMEHDARGIPLTRVCDLCEVVKLSEYRSDVLTDSNYQADEPIEEN